MKRLVLAVVMLLAGCRQDRDGDGFVGRDDCDDRDADVYPGAPERCNDLDDDCDGDVDEVHDLVPVYLDEDGDGVGAGEALRTCPAPAGYEPMAGDCDDTDPDVFPGAPEVCDGVDQDCDGELDEDPEPPLYADDDADGFGDPAKPADCAAFAVADASDCNDADDEVFPGAPERCNGLDDDCDGLTTGEEDADEDGALACADCADDDPSRSEIALEQCNGVDDDCDDVVDGPEVWWAPEAAVRLRVGVEVAAGSTSPLVLPFDGRAALDAAGRVTPFDPGTLRAAWQDCDQLVELPVAWTEDESWALGGTAPDVFELGTVVVLFDTDGDLDTVEPWPGDGEVGLYLEVPGGGSWSGGLSVGPSSVDSGVVQLVLDPDAGGLAELRDGGGVRWSQAQARVGNGIRTPDGALAGAAHIGEVAFDDEGPVTAAHRASVSMSNGDGGIDASWGYRTFAGRSEVWVKPRFTTTQTTTLSGVKERTETVRPWQVMVPGLGELTTLGGFENVRVDAPVPVAWSWVVAPAFLTHVGTDERRDEAWSSANDVSDCCGGSTGSVGSGAELVDSPILRVDLDGVGALPVAWPLAPEVPATF